MRISPPIQALYTSLFHPEIKAVERGEGTEAIVFLIYVRGCLHPHEVSKNIHHKLIATILQLITVSSIAEDGMCVVLSYVRVIFGDRHLLHPWITFQVVDDNSATLVALEWC